MPLNLTIALSRARFAPIVGLPEVELIYGFMSFGLVLAGDASFRFDTRRIYRLFILSFFEC